MRYVILRDDDTNALAPIECLERLYRPFLDLGLPVNLAVIPRVRTDTLQRNGRPEGFLLAKRPNSVGAIPLTENAHLLRYLHANRGYCVAQHGYHHTADEFASEQADEIRKRIERGRELFSAAGFENAATFVAPYDRYSAASIREVCRHFRVFSTGWFELRLLPRPWWPLCVLKKILRRAHWRVGRTFLLSHPGCLLSRHRPRAEMFDAIRSVVTRQRLTVLVTHWWEYFHDGKPDESFIGVLHQTARWLSDSPDVRVISFGDLASGNVRTI